MKLNNKFSFKWHLFFIVLICISLIFAINMFFKHKPFPRVAHAGGGFNHLSYTDSIDALNYNKDHYEIFEIDLVFTSDRHLVCLHDWEDSVYRTFGKGFSQHIPNIAEFKSFVEMNDVYKNCTFEDLSIWLYENPTKKIITDIKYVDNLNGLNYIASHYPHFKERIIPQIYQPEEYEIVKNMGYKNIIWTLYLYPESEDKIFNNAKKMSLYAITMPPSRVEAGLAARLDFIGIKTYVHTINDNKSYEYFKSLGVDEIYTDWLLESK